MDYGRPVTSLDEIRTVGVAGAGQMGAGIAQVFAIHGYDVLLSDRDQATAEQGKKRIQRSLERQLERGKLGADAVAGCLNRIATVAPGAFEPADLMVEAAPENLELKRSLFRQLDSRCPEKTLFCSNTSSISITRLAAATRRPDRFVGMHFMNPVVVMQLVEIVVGVRTNPDTVRVARELAEKLGKTAVVSQDRPGFIVNRVLIPLLNEACFALQEGVASAEDIDLAVRLGLNHPMGPLALADLIGLDTVLSIAEVLQTELGEDKYRPAALLRNLVAAGLLGKKTGRGFYEYE